MLDETRDFPSQECGGALSVEPAGALPAGLSYGIGEVAERSNATDCKSVALAASEVRILPSPPSVARASAPGRGDGARRAAGTEAVAVVRPCRLRRETARRGTVRADPTGSGSNSVVESQPSKLLVAGSIPVSRSSIRAAGRNGRRDPEARPSAGAPVPALAGTSRCSSVVERVLGKDEVTGSSPVIGSSLRPRRRGAGGGARPSRPR